MKKISSMIAVIILLLLILGFNLGRMFERNEIREDLLNRCKPGAYCKISGTDVAIDAFGHTRDLRPRR